MNFSTLPVQGIPVAVAGLREAVENVVGLAAREQVATSIRGARAEGGYFFTFTGAHGITAAKRDAELRRALCSATANFADGMPVVWSQHGRLRRFAAGRRGEHSGAAGRVFGPDFMAAMIAASAGTGWEHFFCGGAEGVAESLAKKLTGNWPGTVVAGCHCPPFRPIDEDELRKIAAAVDTSGAKLVWIGLSTPKQEKLMARLAPLLPGRLLFGVGAAFDIHAGLAQAAPPVIQDAGLEWAWRMVREPRRLLPRYAKVVPAFLLGELLERLQRAK